GSVPARYHCAGRPMAAWAFLVSPLIWMAPDAYWPLVLASVVLGFAGLWAFHDLLQALFPESPFETALLTAGLGVFPVVVAGTVDLNPDHGVLVFFLLVLRALVRDKPLQATLAGSLLVFTKEPGALLYALAICIWAAKLLIRRERFSPAWPLAIPLAAFGAFVIVRSQAGADPLWHPAGGRASLVAIFTTFRLNRAFGAQLLGIFV